MKRCLDPKTAFLRIQNYSCSRWKQVVGDAFRHTQKEENKKVGDTSGFQLGWGWRKTLVHDGGRHCSFDKLKKLLMTFFLYSTVSNILHERDTSN